MVVGTVLDYVIFFRLYSQGHSCAKYQICLFILNLIHVKRINPHAHRFVREGAASFTPWHAKVLECFGFGTLFRHERVEFLQVAW